MNTRHLCAILVVAMLALCGTAHAQTYAYRLVKKVSKYGEVQEVSNSKKIYVTFQNGKSSFYISKRDGSRAGFPDESTGYASGFNNGCGRDMLDPQNFQFSSSQGNLRVYTNSRPIRQPNPGSFGMNFNVRTQSSITDYVTDYAKFNADYSRINVIPNSDKGMYGHIPFGIGLSGWNGNSDFTTFVYEQVKEPNVSNQDFY